MIKIDAGQSMDSLISNRNEFENISQRFDIKQ